MQGFIGRWSPIWRNVLSVYRFFLPVTVFFFWHWQILDGNHPRIQVLVQPTLCKSADFTTVTISKKSGSLQYHCIAPQGYIVHKQNNGTRKKYGLLFRLNKSHTRNETFFYEQIRSKERRGETRHWPTFRLFGFVRLKKAHARLFYCGSSSSTYPGNCLQRSNSSWNSWL